MSLDSDVLLTTSPYHALKAPPLRDHHLLLPEEGDGCNVGFMYMQNVAPHGGVRCRASHPHLLAYAPRHPVTFSLKQ